MSPRLLIILHPGQVTRHAMLSIAAAARELGVLGTTIEAQPIWTRIAAAGGQHLRERAAVAAEVRALCARHRMTHAIGYLGNLAYDCGLFPPAPGAESHGPVGLFPSLGVRHLMLWTDHPEWAIKGAALDDPLRKLLAHPMHTHFIKSACAAIECGPTSDGGVLGWANVHAIHMGEDPTLLLPTRNEPPACDAVTIMSDAAAPPEPLRTMLDHDDPDPAELTSLMLPTARRAWDAAASAINADAGASSRLFDAWTSTRIANPETGFATLAVALASEHAPALAALRSSPRAWYRAVGALRAVTAWRRNFWPAWLARRRNVELHASSGTPLGINAGNPAWVAYHEQPSIYARGAACLTINAGHDEEGLTHKAFQIAASGGALVHHRSRGLDECFTEGEEVISFGRGSELLSAVDRLVRDPTARRRIGDAARARLERHHSWRRRLEQMLMLAQGDEHASASVPALETKNASATAV
jgi:hypothetical protein